MRKVLKTVSVFLAMLMLFSAFSILSIAAENTDLSFDVAKVRADDGISLLFGVKKTKLEGYDSFYMSYSQNGGEAVKVENYIEAGDKYYFRTDDIAAKEIDDKISAVLTAKKGTEEENGAAFEYSVSQYCYDVLGDLSAEAWEKTLASSLLAYGAEAQKYFGYNVNDLVNSYLSEAQKALAMTVDKNALTSVYENSTKDSAVTITGATIEHSGTPRLVIQMTRSADSDSETGLTVMIAGEGISESIEETAFKEIDGKLYAYTNSISFEDFSKTLTISVFRGRAPVSNTVKYSVESYVAEKKDDAETSAIALTMLAYSRAVLAAPEASMCEFGHTYDYEAYINESHNATVNQKCSACGEFFTFNGKGFTSTQWNSIEGGKSTDFRSKTVTATSVKYVLFDHADPYVGFRTSESGIDLTEYAYMVVYYKSDSTFKIGLQGGANQFTFNSTDGEWTAAVIKHNKTGSIGNTRVDFAKSAGKDVYVEINSIAFFKTEEEAMAYKGAFGHLYKAESSIDAQNNLSMTSTCSMCGATETTNGKGFTSTQWNSVEGGKSTDFKSKTVTDTSVKYVIFNHGDPYVGFRTEESGIDLTEYAYMVVYYKSDSVFKIGLKGGANEITFNSTDGEWTAAVIKHNKTGSIGSTRIDFAENAGRDVYVEINSIVFFKTAEEAQAFAGVGIE